MKIIRSAGGPSIMLDRDLMHHWSGVFGKRFVGKQSPFVTDYEAACDLTNGAGRPPVNIAKLQGIADCGLLIPMPFETAIIESDGTSVYIAQVQYAELDWSFSAISRRDFDKAEFRTRRHLLSYKDFHLRSFRFCLFR
jgi:hypothetical protein